VASTRNLPGNKGRPARVADNLTAISEPTVGVVVISRATFECGKEPSGSVKDWLNDY
jgi:hypothetical protein